MRERERRRERMNMNEYRGNSKEAKGEMMDKDDGRKKPRPQGASMNVVG